MIVNIIRKNKHKTADTEIYKHVKERDKTIADKELRIYDLKKQNQELKKKHQHYKTTSQ